MGLFNLTDTPCEFALSEVLLPCVHCLELCSINRDHRSNKQPDLPAQNNELRARRLDSGTIIFF